MKTKIITKQSMKIKTLTLVILTVFFYSSVNAQSAITIDASQNMTNFNFIDSQGNRDEDYKPVFSGSYSLGYRYTSDFGLFGGIKLGMRNAGASLVYNDTDHEWRLQYADVRLDVGYMYNFNKLGVFLTASPYLGYLLRASQTINNKSYDIIESGELETIDYGVFIAPGVNYEINDYISVYSQFNYMLGLQNIETREDQVSNNTLMGLTLGLAFTIK